MLDTAVTEALNATPPPEGHWHPIHQLLTAAGGAPAVCLLSSVELRATSTTVCAVTRSSTAASNLAAQPRATLVVWADGLHYLSLERRGTVSRDGADGHLFGVLGVRVDDIGIRMRPLEYRMEGWLAAAERWDTTNALLDELSTLPA